MGLALKYELNVIQFSIFGMAEIRKTLPVITVCASKAATS